VIQLLAAARRQLWDTPRAGPSGGAPSALSCSRAWSRCGGSWPASPPCPPRS